MKNSNTDLTPAHLDVLRQFSGCLIANAIESFQTRLRNEGFAHCGIHSVFPQLPPIVGYAAPIKIRGSAPPTAGNIYPDRSDWWDFVLSIPEPRIVVVEDCATRPGVGSLIGAVHANILRALGCVGAVTNGAVRDIPELDALGFPVFAGNVAVSHAYVHIIDVGGPVEVGGLKVQAGDLLHGDVHGMQSIPLNIAAQVPEVALQMAQDDEMLIALCQSRDFSLEKLQGAVAKTRY